MPTLTVQHATFFKRTPVQASALPERDKVAVNVGQALTVAYAYRVGLHCFVKLDEGLGTVGKLGYFFAQHVNVPISEMRGVWITSADSTLLNSIDSIQSGLQQLKAAGFNTIYPVVWTRGFTLYPSAVAQAFLGASVLPDSPFEQRDMLAEVVQVARSLDLRVIAWFEYGLMSLPGSTLEKQHPERLTLSQTGSSIRIRSTDKKPDFHIWMNPCRPDVQKFLTSLITEVAANYDVDGIQLDDHFGFPVELGYDAFTQALYKTENQGKPAPSNHTDPAWTKWASHKMTDLLTQIVQSVKQQRSDCIISLSPNPLGFTKTNFLADWQIWVEQGLVDELVLQVYRDWLFAFRGELDKPEVQDACGQVPVAIGILAGLSTRSVSSSTIAAQIQATRQRGFAGVSLFFYETVFNQGLSPVMARRPADLQRFFA